MTLPRFRRVLIALLPLSLGGCQLLGAGGSMIGNPLVYENVIGTAYFNGSLLIHSPNEPGNFAPLIRTAIRPGSS